MARRARYSLPSQGIESLVRLWILRILVPLGGHKEFIRQHGFSSDALAEEIGLGEWINPEPKAYDPARVQVELRQLHQKAEAQSADAVAPPALRNNLARFSDLVGLSDAEIRILEFAVLIHAEPLLDTAANTLESLTSIKVCYVLATLLDLPEQTIRAALSAMGALGRSGLVRLDRNTQPLCGKLDLLSNGFADKMLTSDADPVELLRDTLSLSSPGQLSIADYGHIAPALAVLRPYLKRALATGRKGVNIFLHGAPGTGKNELAKALAKELDCELFEVASEDEDGDPIKGERRLRAVRAAQSIFSQRRAIILFDETEDVFNDGGMFNKSTAQTHKAWINRILEDNPAPCLWLSNTLHGLDPAFVRRFDMVIELPVPSRKQREQILQGACSGLLASPDLARIAEVETLAPAVVTRAASIVRLIRDDMAETTSTAAFELLISHTLEAQGHNPLHKDDPNRLPEIYDPAFIHADQDLTRLSEGLTRTRSGRLCLYGPPGTGKTAYGRWLAGQMGVPLQVKRASDLMSMWLGETEKNMARAFKVAEQDGALLLIDEVDSFLQDRRQAQRGWEVSQVNEMLTQMEAFSGVFIASTNLMEGLDQAALRRFDLKVRFGFLRPEQTSELLRRYCDKLGLPTPGPECRERLNPLTNLTPGDFAAVARQHRFRPIESPAALVAALEAECALKEGVKRSIGFVH